VVSVPTRAQETGRDVAPPPAAVEVATAKPDVDGPSPAVDRLLTLLTTPNPVLLAMYAGLAAAFMMAFVQGDILYNSLVADQIARGHLDVYAYFATTRKFAWLDTVMPPLYYLVTAAYLKLLMMVHLDPVTTQVRHFETVVFGIHHGLAFSFGLLLVKIPNLIAVIVGLFLAQKLARDAGADWRVVALLWAASPAMIVTALMQAQNDPVAATVTLGALVAYRARGPTWVMLLLGLAGCFKTYALILVPVTALVLSKRNLLATVKYGLVGIVAPVITALPFMIDNAHYFLHRMVGAHDGGTLFGTAYTGRLPTHLWPIFYVGVLLLAWWFSARPVRVTDLLGLWFLALAPIFIVNWWVPQWIAWLLPMAIIFAASDRLFAVLWLAVNALVLANDLFNFPANMDGGLLMPIFGEHHHPPSSHYYAYHLYLLYRIVPYVFRDGVYILIGVAFIALCIRVIQWLLSPFDARHPQARRPGWGGVSLPSTAVAALVAPLLLVPYVAVMVVQRLVG
jgi:hypothetical protein